MKYLVYSTVLMLSGSFIQAKRTRAAIHQDRQAVRAAIRAQAALVAAGIAQAQVLLAETQDTRREIDALTQQRDMLLAQVEAQRTLNNQSQQ